LSITPTPDSQGWLIESCLADGPLMLGLPCGRRTMLEIDRQNSSTGAVSGGISAGKARQY
jgi:hypothetical protein